MSCQVPAWNMVCVSAAQDHMKSMQAIVGINRLDSLSSPTTQTQFDPNAVAGRRRRRPLTESNGRVVLLALGIDRGQ